MRQRSNTISKMMHVAEDQGHLCAFDSFLHATICSNLNNNSSGGTNCITTTTSSPNKNYVHSPTTGNTKITNKIPCKQMNGKIQQTQCQQFRLNKSILNQINPNLTAEQKLSRKLYDVEKWLLEREQNNVTCYRVDNVVEKSRLQKDQENLILFHQQQQNQDKNILNSNLLDKLKITDHVPPVTQTVTSTPKKVFNKEVLISKRSKSHNHHSQRSPVDSNKSSNTNNKNNIVLEYSNVPVNVEASECENLISMSDEETPSGSCATVVNNKPSESSNVQETEVNGGASASNASSSKSSQSTVHRYVHYHYHYHYLKDENDE